MTYFYDLESVQRRIQKGAQKGGKQKGCNKRLFHWTYGWQKKVTEGRRMSPNKSPVKVIQTEEQCKSGKRTVGQRQRQEVKWAKTSHIYWIYFCLLITSFLHPVTPKLLLVHHDKQCFSSWNACGRQKRGGIHASIYKVFCTGYQACIK